MANSKLNQQAERMAPVQGYVLGIPWALHLEAYAAYCKRYGKQQALIEGGCRGGFGTEELDVFIPGWRDKISEIGRLKARIAELEAHAAAPAQGELSDAEIGKLFEKARVDFDNSPVITAPVEVLFAHALEQRIRGQVSDAADAARLDWLQEQPVDTLYMDDGKIVDVRGGDLRKAIDAAIQAQAGDAPGGSA